MCIHLFVLVMKLLEGYFGSFFMFFYFKMEHIVKRKTTRRKFYEIFEITNYKSDLQPIL